jgi:hypothetical protein
MLLPLLVLIQTVEPDEAAAPSRLFAKPVCKPRREEILVCAQPHPDRLAKLPADPDPMTTDRRPTLWLTKHIGVRIGFMISPAFR